MTTTIATGMTAASPSADRWLPLRLSRQARLAAAERHLEAAARTALRAWLRVARRATLPALTAAGLPPDPASLAATGRAWLDAVTAHLAPAVAGTFDAGATDALNDEAELLRFGEARSEYLAVLPNRLTGVPDEAWRQVTATVAEQTAAGAPIPAIRAAVGHILGTAAWNGRAQTIARTETVGAYNAGTLAAWLAADAGERVDKVWVSTHDSRTRDDHREADGQRAPLDGVFLIGGSPMRHPGDPTAPPGQTVLCRCTMIEVPAGEPLPDVPTHPWPRDDPDRGDLPVTAATRPNNAGGAVMPTWTGVPLAPLGELSGDRRVFAADGEWSFRELPLPLRWVRQDADGHDGAVTIGRILDGTIVDGKEITGGGDFLDAIPETAEAIELLRAGVLYPSVDLDDFDWTYADPDTLTPVDDLTDERIDQLIADDVEPVMLVTRGRVIAVTLVATQAFPQARVELVGDPTTNTADGPDDIATADRGRAPQAVTASANSVTSRRLAAPIHPPKAWFDDPRLAVLTPIQVDANGRVYGHLADRDCHLSFLNRGVCILPPDEGGFDWFHRPEILTADGALVAVGHITAGCGHADLSASAATAIAHYDDTGTQVAVVRAGRDPHGIWVAGALVPEATEQQIQLLRRSPLSGDWRLIGGVRQLVAALCVNVGGYPIVRGRASGGRAVALVAAGWTGWRPISAGTDGTSPVAIESAVRRAVAAGFAAERRHAATRAAVQRVAADIGRDHRSLVATLDAEVHAATVQKGRP